MSSAAGGVTPVVSRLRASGSEPMDAARVSNKEGSKPCCTREERSCCDSVWAISGGDIQASLVLGTGLGGAWSITVRARIVNEVRFERS